MTKPLTHAYGHRLADMQFGGSAPAFTLSADGQMPIASVVSQNYKKQKMKTLLCISTLLLLISCGQKNSNQTAKTHESAVVTFADNLKVSDNNIELKKYVADGLFLKGEFSIFDNTLKKIGKLQITEIESTQILERSSKIYNIDGNTDNCQKAFFVKVKFKNKDYILFGKDIYEIDNKQTFNIFNTKKEKLTLFPVKNFVMGASDEEGLTGCDEFSILVLYNSTLKLYSLIKFPKNGNVDEVAFKPKYAMIIDDDRAGEKIYKVSMTHDTLVIGIKAIYQEGGSVYNLKTKLSTDFPNSEITDTIYFRTDEEVKKMDEIK